MLRVHRILQGLHLRRFGPAGIGRRGPEARAAQLALHHLHANNVLSGTLTGMAPEDLSIWMHNAKLAKLLLPQWMVRIHYNSSLDDNPDAMNSLRYMTNMQLVEMYGATLPVQRWQHLPLFDETVQALVFLGHPPNALTPCAAESIAAWVDGCGSGGGSEGGEVLRIGKRSCERLEEAVWGVGGDARAVARNALRVQMQARSGSPAGADSDGVKGQLLRKICGRGKKAPHAQADK